MQDEQGKLTVTGLGRVEFENTFGQKPIGLGYFLSDPAKVLTGSMLGAYIGMTIAGWPLGLLIAAAGLNDVLYTRRKGKKAEAESGIKFAEVEIVETNEMVSSTAPLPPSPAAKAPTILQDRQIPPFDRERILNEAKGLMIIGDMGAAKTCVAQYIAGAFSGHQIIVFDPHGKTAWGNVQVLTKMQDIYAQMRILLDLLEEGDETPLLIIADEWIEIRGDNRNRKGGDYPGLAEDFIRLFSTKPRKFNKLAMFVLHSPNVEAAGVDSFLRENYLKIYLGRLAKKQFPYIEDCAYPCVVEDEQQQHPTHGHHTEFKPIGMEPRNLSPLESAPITIPLASQRRATVENVRHRLEESYKLDSIPSQPKITSRKEAIAKLSLNAQKVFFYIDLRRERKDWFEPRDIQQSKALPGLSSDKIKLLFDEIVAAGLAEENGKGAIKLVE